MMAAKMFFFVLIFTAATVHTINGIIVYDDLVRGLNTDGAEHEISFITSKIRNEDPNTIKEILDFGTSFKSTVKGVCDFRVGDLNRTESNIKKYRQQSNPGSPSALCYQKLLREVTTVRQTLTDSKKLVEKFIDIYINVLVELAKALLNEIQLDLEVGKIIKLSMHSSAYPKIEEEQQRLKFFNEHGAHLSVGQKAKGEDLLKQITEIQLRILYVYVKTRGFLDNLYSDDAMYPDRKKLEEEQEKCAALPGNNRSSVRRHWKHNTTEI